MKPGIPMLLLVIFTLQGCRTNVATNDQSRTVNQFEAVTDVLVATGAPDSEILFITQTDDETHRFEELYLSNNELYREMLETFTSEIGGTVKGVFEAIQWENELKELLGDFGETAWRILRGSTPNLKVCSSLREDVPLWSEHSHYQNLLHVFYFGTIPAAKFSNSDETEPLFCDPLDINRRKPKILDYDEVHPYVAYSGFAVWDLIQKSDPGHHFTNYIPESLFGLIRDDLNRMKSTAPKKALKHLKSIEISLNYADANEVKVVSNSESEIIEISATLVRSELIKTILEVKTNELESQDIEEIALRLRGKFMERFRFFIAHELAYFYLSLEPLPWPLGGTALLTLEPD